MINSVKPITHTHIKDLNKCNNVLYWFAFDTACKKWPM